MFSTIVVGTDGSPTARKAVAQAAELAKVGDATLHVVGAYSSATSLHLSSAGAMTVASVDVAGTVRDHAAQVESMLDETAVELRRQGVKVDTHAVAGDPAQGIVDVAKTYGADLIVVGNRGMTGAKRLLGSVPNKVAHGAPCSVMIVYTS